MQNIDLDIEGMTCTACARRIEKNLNKVEGVKAYVDFASEKAHISIAGNATREALIAVVEDTGYSVAAGKPQTQAMVWRLQLGAIISAPVAVISMVPAIMPMQWPLISAILTAPVAAWVAWPFHSAAFKNLKQRATTMDTLVSLGVIVAYLYSLAVLAQGGMDTYFEVAAVVPTVVLFGRWLEVRTRRSATDAVRALLAAVPETAMVRRDGKQFELPTSQVKAGDTLVIAAGQKVPVDGLVAEVSGEWAQLDNSLITGESVPELLGVGASVAAGALNVGGLLVITASATSSNSRIAQIADLVREATSQKAKISNLADSISSVFVPVVIGISLATLGVWAFGLHNPESGLRAAIAVLVIACPCALGIAVPVSLAVATAMGAKRGVVIRHPDTLSLLGKLRFVVLDKTGTLTTGKLAVTKAIALDGFDKDRAIALAAAVERGSVHPIATAIAAQDQTLAAANIRETAGLGVVGIVDGQEIEVGRRAPQTFENAAELSAAIEQVGPRSLAIVSIANRAVLVFGLEDDLRPTAVSGISQLRQLGIEPILLSGDIEPRVADVAALAGIGRHYSSVTPERKLEVIANLRVEGRGLVAMVGDGLNDVAALATADVGIAMGSGTHATQSAAAITILDDDPEAIAYSIRLGRRTFRNIRQNLGWAFGYNMVLIPVAAMGLLNPMLSGTAMAFSSVSVVLNALRLRRQ